MTTYEYDINDVPMLDPYQESLLQQPAKRLHKRGPKRIHREEITTNNFSQSNANVVFYTPGTNVLVTSRIDLVADLLFSAITPAAQDAAFSADGVIRNMPLAHIIDVCTTKINGQTADFTPADLILAFSRITTDEDYRKNYLGTTPTY
jgi:hypothetical protein